MSDGVIGIFRVTKSFPNLVVLGFTQSPTEMSTKDFLGGKGGRCVRLTTLPPSCVDCLKILGASTGTLGAYLGLYWESFTLLGVHT